MDKQQQPETSSSKQEKLQLLSKIEKLTADNKIAQQEIASLQKRAAEVEVLKRRVADGENERRQLLEETKRVLSEAYRVESEQQATQHATQLAQRDEALRTLERELATVREEKQEILRSQGALSERL